jgi:hypothetical protein
MFLISFMGIALKSSREIRRWATGFRPRDGKTAPIKAFAPVSSTRHPGAQTSPLQHLYDLGTRSSSPDQGALGKANIPFSWDAYREIFKNEYLLGNNVIYYYL